jgi:hypothetical protein
MGWLSLSIILSFFAMWDYKRINKQRDEYCAREGIDASRRAEFRDLGSESPLFRCVQCYLWPYSERGLTEDVQVYDLGIGMGRRRSIYLILCTPLE